MEKTIKERQMASEEVKISGEYASQALEMVPFTTLYRIMMELEEVGVLDLRPSENFDDGQVWMYNDRKVTFIRGFTGRPKWNFGERMIYTLHEPHDLAIDEKTNMVLAYARSL